MAFLVDSYMSHKIVGEVEHVHYAVERWSNLINSKLKLHTSIVKPIIIVDCHYSSRDAMNYLSNHANFFLVAIQQRSIGISILSEYNLSSADFEIDTSTSPTNNYQSYYSPSSCETIT